MTAAVHITISDAQSSSRLWGVRRRAWLGSGIAGLAALTLLLGGCTARTATTGATTSAAAVVTMTTTASATTAPMTATRAIPKNTANDLKNNSAHHSVAFDGESFRLKIDYFTSIDAGTWGAIGPKDVHLLAYVNPAADAKVPDVVMDEVDAQYSLLAANSALDGLVVEQGQDRSGAGVPGFLVTPKISYGGLFSTAGISPELIERWQALKAPMPMEEASVQAAGVYAVKISFTYRLLVKSAGDSTWHRRTAVDHLTVPVEPVAPAPTTGPTPASPVPVSSTASTPTG